MFNASSKAGRILLRFGGRATYEALRIAQIISSRYPHPPVEDLCLGLLFASLFHAGSFCYFHSLSRHRFCPFLSALPLPHRAKNQPAIWKSPPVSTLLPIFPSSSSMAKSAVLSWLLSLAPTVLNTPPSSRLKNSSTCLPPLKSPAP